MIQFILFTDAGVQTLSLQTNDPKAQELLASGEIRGGTIVLEMRTETPLVVPAHNFTEKQIKYLCRKVESLDLSARADNCLRGANYVWVWELCESEASELLKIKNLGRKVLNEIIDELAKNGDGLELSSVYMLDPVRHLLPESVFSFTEAQIAVLRQDVEETDLPQEAKEFLRERGFSRIWMICAKRPVDVYCSYTCNRVIYQFLQSHSLRAGIGRQLDKVRHRLVDT